jgi:tubulin--tyrosine ligase
MLDEAGRAYLIEMNTSPALFREGRYLLEMLPRMIEEVVQKCVHTVFPAPEGAAQADGLHNFLQIVPPLL